MEIYLVRHGETEGNIAQRHQVDSTQLTNAGKDKIRVLAEKFRELKPTHLITSKIVRAIQTAEIVGEVTNLVPETSQYFIELERPRFLYGNFHFSLASFWFYFLWYLGLTKEGESYEGLRSRIKQAQAQLAEYPDDARVIIISHTVFINMFVAHMCDGKRLTPLKAMVTFYKLLRMPNAHSIKIRFDNSGTEAVCKWFLE